MFISRDRVSIRSAKLNDVSILCKWWADGIVMAHAGFPNGIKTDESKLINRIKVQNSEILPRNQLIIIELDSNFPIGEMNYREKAKDIYEIGIKICVIGERSKGYGAIAINLLIEYLKDTMNAKKIVLDTNLKNTGAQKFYKRLGFKQTKIEEDFWKDQVGNLQSAVFFEMIFK